MSRGSIVQGANLQQFRPRLPPYRCPSRRTASRSIPQYGLLLDLRVQKEGLTRIEENLGAVIVCII